MKTSLLKRAFAAAVSVPLALSQCFTVASAAEPVTLNDTVLYINPINGLDGNDDYTRVDDNTFEKLSDWNATLLGKLTSTNKKTGTYDATPIFNRIIKKSGNYKEVTEKLLSHVSTINYTIAENGDITFTGSLSDIVPDFTDGGKKTIGKALNDLADQYGADELKDNGNIFKDIVIAGDFTAVIKGSSLDDTKVEAEFTFVDKTTGKAYKGTGVVDYAAEKFAELKAAAYAEVENVQDKYNIDVKDAKAQIDSSISFYERQLTRSFNYVNKAQAKVTEEKHYDTLGDAIKAANNSRFAAKAYDLSAKHNIDPNEYLTLEKVASYYEKALKKANNFLEPTVIDISVDELIGLGKDMYDITTKVGNGVATFSAKFTDAEAADAMAYISDTYDVTAKESYKEVLVTVDFSSIKDEQGGTGSADVKIKRVVKVEPKEVVTTTTTTTKPGETTTTTTTETKPGETTTTTTETTKPGETTTTTTETTKPGETTTTTTETTKPGETTTTTTETTKPGETTTTTTETTKPGESTTTTTTETTKPGESTTTTTSTIKPGDSTTTTTTTKPGDSTTTTTTTIKPGVSTTTTTTTTKPGDSTTTTTTTTGTPVTTTKAVKGATASIDLKTKTTAGFYLNIDKEFNKNQIESINCTFTEETSYIGEDGKEVGEKKVEKSDAVSILDKIGFGEQTPANMADSAENFKTTIKVYATEDIATADGTVVIKKGDTLKDSEGNDLTLTVYIGVKGDANLDGKVGSNDASCILVWYSKMSTGADAAETTFSTSELVKDDALLDEFAAFLSDVNNENDENNFSETKGDRQLLATDATFILAMYAKVSTGAEMDRATWNEVLGDTYAKQD